MDELFNSILVDSSTELTVSKSKRCFAHGSINDIRTPVGIPSAL